MRHADQTALCHQEAATLLPWYVNGTLALEERRRVEEHLAMCAVCRDEMVALLKVQAALRRELADAPEPSAALWRKVRDRIAAPPASPDRLVVRPQDRWTWARLGDLLRPALHPGWALAALVLIAVQAAVIVGLVVKGPSRGSPAYRTLTGPTETGQPSGPRVRLRVAFKEEATEQAMRAALGEVRAAIVDGPSAAGFYLIDVPLDGGSVRTAEDALRAFRKHPEVIRFADLATP